MKYFKSLKFFCVLFVPGTFLLAQAPSTIAGQTLTANYQTTTGEPETGTAVFRLFENNKTWEYDNDDGEWEYASFEWMPDGESAFLKLIWEEGEYVDLSLKYTNNTGGTFTFVSWEINESGVSAIENEGFGDFSFSTTAESEYPPFSHFFSDDFSQIDATRENFHLGDGDTLEGMTIIQNNEYSLRGTYVSDDSNADEYKARWFEVHANTVLPMNRSWVVEADLFMDEFSGPSAYDQIDFMFTMLQLNIGSSWHIEVGSTFSEVFGFTNRARIYQSYGTHVHEESHIAANLGSVNYTYRIVNDSSDYTLFLELDTNGSNGQLTTKTLMSLEWDDGWLVNYDGTYPSWTPLDNWESFGDKYAQPFMYFELPHSWSDGHGSDYTMYELEGGEIGFRSFSVQPDPEIIEFDDGEDFPAFYNKLSTEVGQGGNTSRYHLLKGLHDLAQLAESTSSNSLKQFAVSLGVDDSIIDFSLADTPLAGTYEFELDRAFQTGELALFFQDSFIPQLESIDEHFAQVSDTVIMETLMTGAEEDVTVDATDVKVLRAMVNLLGAFTSLQSAYDWNYNIGNLQDLDMEVTETSLEEVRAQHPTLFGVRSVTHLQKAKAFLQSAVNVYKEASSGLRTSGRYATPQNDPDFLFVLDESDFEDETQFIADLNEFYDALSNNYTITDDEEYSGTVISLSAFFNGGLDLPNLLPDSVGDQLSADQLTDPTIGGILPGATYANTLFLQDLREEFYEDELIEGQPVRHDSLKEALEEFDYLTYLDLNPELGEWYQTEANAKQHFTERGFWDEGRYFYYPFETPSQNLVSEQLVGRKVSSSGTIADLDNLNFTITHYFVDSIHAVTHYNSDNPNIMADHWSKEKYFFKRMSRDSASFVLINNDGDKLIADVAFQNAGSGTTNLQFIENGGDVAWNQGTGNWVVSDFSLSEIPLDLQDEPIFSDYAPNNVSEGVGYNQPSLENNDTFWPEYAESIDFQDYGDQHYTNKSFNSQVTIPSGNGSENVYGNGQFDYFKTGPNSATLTLRFPDNYNWHADERRFVYNLQFTGENTGNYVKYSDFISQTDVTTGPFVLRNVSATSIYAWEDYDDFESGSLDSTKWETGYFSGGREPRIASWTGGYRKEVQLWGEAFTGADSAKLPESATSPEWQNVLTDSDGEGNSGIAIFDDSIIGVQAKLLLDYSNAIQTGVHISAMFVDAGIELAKRGEWQYEDEWGYSYTTSEPYFSYDSVGENGEVIKKKKRASLGQWYEVSVIRQNGKAIVILDGEKLSEIDRPVAPEAWSIGAFNDAGQPFSAYVDDVRVLRRSSSEFNADALVVDEIEGGRDSVYLQTSNGPELIEGAGEFGFDIFLPNEPEFSAAELVLNGQTYDLTQDEAPLGFRTRYGYGRGEIHELYDIESYSNTDLSSFSVGAEFIFSLSHNGNDYSFTHNVVAESALPSPPNLSINGDGNWTTDPTEGHEYLKLAPAQTVVVSWDSFLSDDEYDHINISLQRWVGDEEYDVFDDEDLVVSADSTSYEFSGDLLEPGQKYTFYVEFVDVTETFNPEGFRRAVQTDDEPILFTYASSITALDMEIVGVSSGALDGIVIYIESEDPVKETLIFENGALTSIFDEDDGQNIHKNERLSYQYYEINDNQFSITMEGGEHYIFYENNGTGRLLDYSNNGELDESGTWDFTFIIHDWEEYDDFNDGTFASDKWETGYWDGAQAPEIVDGKARLSSNGSGVGSQVPSFMDDMVGMPESGTNHSFLTLSDSSVIGVEAEISLSSSSTLESGLYLGIFEDLESGPGFAFAGIELGYWDQSGPSITFDNSVYVNGEETLDEVLQEKPASLGQSYKISVVEGESTYQLFLDNELVQEYPIRGELLSFHFGAFQEPSVSFDTFVDNVRVLREPLGEEVVTVVSDPNGKPVVNQVGDEYRWNDTLDDLTIWLVGYDSGELVHGTVKYENGQVYGKFEFIDEVIDSEEPINYYIDDSGYLVWEESMGLQYFQILLVDDGKIETTGGFFFTTRAAAEEFYNSKTSTLNWEQYDDFSGLIGNDSGSGYAPESIVGTVININLNFTEGIEEQTETYFKDRKVFHNGDGDWTYYDYVKTSENQATITYTFEDESDPMPEVVNLTFTSPTEGTFDWAEYTDTSLSTIEDETTGDFSLVGFIDPEKWDLAQWDGGMVPVIENGKMKFSGQPNSSASVESATSAMLAVDSSVVLGDPTSQSPHSLLEFVESQNIKGIELTFSIPSNSPDLMGFGLFAVDYNYALEAEGEDVRQRSVRFDIELWNENGNNADVAFYVKDPVTDIESSVYRNIDFDTSYRLAFVREDSSVNFYLNDDLIGEYPYENRGEYFFVRAMNEVNAPFTTYLENVRVIRREHSAQDGAPIYLLDDNQFMHLTGMAWSEKEANAPDALIFDNYVGHFAVVPNLYFEEGSNDERSTVMPLHTHVLVPVIQDTNGDWVEELPEFDGFGSLYGPEYVETEFGLSPVGHLHEGEPKHEFVKKIYVSGGSFGYPHYTFSDAEGYSIDMEEFVFQPDTKYRFIAENLDVNHPFTIGASINGSDIIKFTYFTEPDLPEQEEHNFTGLTDDLEVLGNDLLMPPIEEDFGDDYVLSINGDYFDFEYSKDFLPVFKENELKLHYLCDIHSSMNGLLRLPLEEVTEDEKYPVFWVTPDLFWELTYIDWEWTSFARFEDPQMGRGAYFAFEDSDLDVPTIHPPTIHTIDLGEHETTEYFNLIHVSELIPEGETPIWIASPDFETYQTQVSPETLESDHNLTVAGYYTPEKMEDFREKVDGFLREFKASEFGNSLEEWVEVRHVEKQNDAINPNRFIYLAELNNEITIFFDQDGDFVHSSNSWSDDWYRNDGVPSEVASSVETELPSSEILELWDEVSVLEGFGFVYRAVVESNSSELFEIYLNNTGEKVHLVSRFFGIIERVFPEVAHEYMEQNYRWEDEDLARYYWTWYDEYAEEFVAEVEGGLMVYFSKSGEFLREFDPWGPPVVEDAGISFNPNRSAWGSDLNSSNFNDNSTGGENPAFVRIEKLELSEVEEENNTEYDSFADMAPIWGGNEEMAYRISLTNSQLDEDANLSLSDLELGSTVLPAGTPLKLSFTYESGEPRYLLVSGAKIRGYKHTWPEHWLDRPGSFTILAETTDSVSTTDGDLESTFGIVVVMEGERYYQNAIFQANIPVIDIEPAQMISPYDQVAAFSLLSEVTGNLDVSAFLPRNLLEWNFGISEPHRVKAGLLDTNGTLYFVDGSGADDPNALITGGGFTRILHEGYEPDIYIDPVMAGDIPYPSDEDESTQYKLGDHESDEEFVYEEMEGNSSVRVKKSKFDFNADGYGDSLLEVRFFADVFPAEVGFGDLYVEPALVGQVSGSILDESGETIPEFGIWFFQAPDGINGSWEPTFFEVDYNYTTGEYTAYLPEGEFYAEAWGNDWENDVYFTPQVASSSLIIQEGSSENYDFILVEEWRPGAHGEIESSLEVNGHVGEEHYDVSIELFPVDENGMRLTEWSAAWLWVEPDGHISGAAPEGRHEVVLYSYDNSIRLLNGPVYWDVVGDEFNEFNSLEAQKSLPVRVSGMIRDAATTEGIWAEVVFVDPNDENNIFWPIWDEFNLAGDVAPDEDSEELVTFAQGLYSVRIPAGSYKIKAVDWSGFYAEQYYTIDGNGTDDFSIASTIEISSELSGIDFSLSGGSVSKINLLVLDKNTSEPIPYAWFDFLDAYDEYGPTTFPRVDYSDDGNFTLTISAGSYKLIIGSPDHETIVLSTDIDGNYIWDEGDWSSAAILEISDDQTISLPDAQMDGGLLPPPPPGDSTISGKVLTGKGVAVPKAFVECYTDDWMFYFEATSRSDGSYEFEGLPAGNWIIVAHPPYDSSEFTGLQPTEPNWDNPIELDESDSVDYNLIFVGSNVSGRILYPKKDENDRTRLKPLPHTFLWAFEDENETGEPPVYEYGIYLEQPAFNEAYGNTDEDGFFSFSLKEAGKYSMRIDVPGELGSFSLDPIHFEVRDPNQELTLGNAIRLDWTKAEARATTYKVERKSASSNSYTIVDNNISGSLKSFVDHTIVPGATYEYRVTAALTSGSQVLSTDSYKVSKPFIYLAPPSKTIVGKVRNDLNASISGAEVQAWKIDGIGGWASAVTDVDGEYELNVGPGKWEVMVYKPWDRKVNWRYDKAPKQVNFADNGNKVEKKANFTVTTMSGGISGVIEIPNELSDYYSSIWIDVWNPDGVGNWTNPEANGSFYLSLSPGEYTISLWLDPAVFSGYSSPEARVIKVGKSELDLGNIQLVQYVPIVLSGVIAIADGTPLGNADVWAWSMEGGWATDVTDSDGSYTLNVSRGTWEIGFSPPMPRDGSASPYLPAPPKRIKIGDSDKTLNFTVRKAGAKVNGVVNGSGGSPISNLYAWAYAREVTDENSSDEFNEVVAEVEVSPRGEFSFPAVPGTYAVGLWLFSEEYLFPEEQILILSENNVLTDENGTALEQITFTLTEVSSRVEGVLMDKESNQSIDGLIGEVYAMSLDGQGRQYTFIESNGSYSMLLAPGNWILEYYIEDDQGRNYPKESVSSVRINLAQGETEMANFTLSSASASISGAVVYDINGSAVTESTLYVWAYREDTTAFPAFGSEVQTDENGAFSLSVLQGGKYEVGVTLSSDLREHEYFDPSIQKITMNSSSKSGILFRLAKPEEDNYLSGSVLDDLGNPLGGASVYAWTFDGAEISGLTNENGEFNMSVTSGSNWKVGAEYIAFDENDSEIIYLIDEELNANLRVNEYVDDIQLVLNRPAFDVPDGKSVTFDPSKDFITTLPDGTEITIPAGAVNVSSDVDSVRFVVTPTASGLDKSGALKPAGYVYSLELFDNRGKLIEGNFKKDVIIRMPIDVEVIRSQGLNADTLKGTYYSPTKKKWEISKTSTWDKESGILTMTTDHFSPNGPSADALESVFDIDNNTNEIAGADNWYESDWLGTFYDASVDSSTWFYHTEEKLGWLWITRDSEESGNYWFYHSGTSDLSSQEWLWTGSDYFIEGDETKSHFYSNKLRRWLYFNPKYGFYDYVANDGNGAYLD